MFDKLLLKSKKLRFQAKTFTLPGGRPGCIIEYSYQMRWHEKFPDVFNHPMNYIVKVNDAMLTAQWMIPEDLFTRRARFSLRPLPTARLIWDTIGLPKDNRPHKQS